MKSSKSVSLAVFLFFVPCWSLDKNLAKKRCYLHPYTHSAKNVCSDTFRHAISTILIYSLIVLTLLLVSGNIHPNLDPDPYQDFNIVHINCRSLNTDKKLLIEAECNRFDIMTLSETWFKDTHTDTHTNI